MVKWTPAAVNAAIKGWFNKWASDEDRMLNALNEAAKAQSLNKEELVDMTMLLAWEAGWQEAMEECLRIAESTEDKYNEDDPYCRGVCDASYGIANDIRRLKL